MIVPFSFQKRTRLWEPGDTPGIVSHYDISTSSGYTGGGFSPITGLNDLQGYRDLSTGGSSSISIGINQNSLNTVELDGASQFLSTSAGDYFTAGGLHWAIIVCSPFSVSNSSDSMWALEGSWRDYQFQAGDALNFYGDLALGNGNTSITNIGNSNNHENGFTIASIAFNMGGEAADMITAKLTSSNGNFTKTGTYSGQIFNSHTLKIGASRNNNQKLPMHFAELFLVAGDASEVTNSTTQIEKAEGYLAHKWGLEGNLDSLHPYKTSPPTKQD